MSLVYNVTLVLFTVSFLNSDIYETTVRRPAVVFPQTYHISITHYRISILHICFDRKLLPISKFTSHSLKLSIILLLSGYISLNPGPEAKNIKISTINARSIKCKTAPCTEFVTSKKLDVVAVTETWLKRNDTKAVIADIALPGYHFYHQPRSNKKVGGGVGVLVSDKFKTKVQKIPSYI